MPTSSEKEIVELEFGVYARLCNLTNSGFIVGDKGVLVIDSLGVPSFARDLIQDGNADKGVQALQQSEKIFSTQERSGVFGRPCLFTATSDTFYQISICSVSSPTL